MTLKLTKAEARRLGLDVQGGGAPRGGGPRNHSQPTADAPAARVARRGANPKKAALDAAMAAAPSGHWPAAEERAALALAARGWIWMWNGARYAGLRGGMVCGACASLVELEGVLA